MTGDSHVGFQNLESALAQQPKARKIGIFLAMQYLREGKPRDAKRITSNLLDQNANNLSALSLHASALASLGDLKKARQSFEKILAIKPDFRSAQLNLIRIDLKEGKEEQARSSIRELLNNNPEDHVLLYEQVKLEQATGHVDQAIRLLEKLYHKAPKEFAINLHLINLYSSTGKAANAIDHASKLLSRHPESIRAMEVLGKAHLLAGDNKAAWVMFKRMSRSVGYNAKQLFRIALLQVRSGDMDEARWSLEKSIEAKPDFYTAIATLTELQIQTQRFEKAAILIQQLKTLAPDNPVTFLLEGSLATKTGDKEAALVAYTDAHKRMNSANTAIQLFKSLLSAGKTEQAIQSLEIWSKAHPKRPDVKKILADIHYQLGNTTQATSYYEAIVSQDKTSGAVYSKLALIYAKSKRGNPLAYAKKAYVLSPENVDVIDTYGWLLTKNGQVKEGLSLLREAVSRNSISPRIHYHIGTALEKLEHTQKAIKAYETALSLGKKFNESEEAKNNLLLLKQLGRAH